MLVKRMFCKIVRVPDAPKVVQISSSSGSIALSPDEEEFEVPAAMLSEISPSAFQIGDLCYDKRVQVETGGFLFAGDIVVGEEPSRWSEPAGEEPAE